MKRLEQKTAIVTGSTGGIGRGIARVFAQEGANVVVTGRNANAGAAVVADISARGGVAHFIGADLRDEAGVEGLVASAIARFGSIDVLVNNAALRDEGRLSSLLETSTERWCAVTHAGLDGMFFTTKHCVAHMVERGGGAIVNISSTSSIEGPIGLTAYAACKGAMNAFTRAVATEYGSAGIRVNTVIPGPIPHREPQRRRYERPGAMDLLLTDRAGIPEDIGYAAAYLASDEAHYVTGAELIVDGGMTCRMAYPRPPVIGLDDG